QSVAWMHCTQVPVPLQRLPLFMLQVALAAAGGFDGIPPVQTSCVHWLPSDGVSLSSLTVVGWPWPSHWISLQSPPMCAAVGGAVPAAVLVTPQVPLVQVWAWQKVSVPQFPALTQPTHAPLPSHIRLVPQTVPLERLGFEGTPPVQTSPVQAL